MFNILESDIHKIVDDVKNCECICPLDEMTQHVLNILKDIGHSKKVLFDRYIRQVIAQYDSDQYGHIYNDFEIPDKTKTVDFIKTLPQHEQRTEEWYNDRINSIGASESAAIFGLNPYENEKKLIIKKCGHKNPNDDKMMKINCQHGIKYEPIIQDMYCNRNNTKIYEFGSLKHLEYPIITASPDGITPTGTMLEIKAPARREITGIPPAYYWVQCQQQMQVCNLDKVDFLEVKLEEYTNSENYINDHMENKQNAPYTKMGLEKNVLIEYHILDSIDDEVGYIYPDKFLNTDEIISWKKSKEDELNKSANKQFRRLIYWSCKKYSLTGIYKDVEWWENNVHKYEEFWNKVLHYRNIGYQDLLPVKRKLKPKTLNDTCCLIMSDNEE